MEVGGEFLQFEKQTWKPTQPVRGCADRLVVSIHEHAKDG